MTSDVNAEIRGSAETLQESQEGAFLEENLPVQVSVSLDWETYRLHHASPGFCSFQLQVHHASPEELQEFPARIGVPDAFVLIKWVAEIWKSRLQSQVEASCQAGGAVVVQTGIDVPQEHLSQAVQAIFRRELHCTSDSVRSFLHIADYLQIDCLLEPILGFVQDTLLPQLPALVFSLGKTFHHLGIYPRWQWVGSCWRGTAGVGLCEAAKQEVLRQLQYQGSDHLASTVWADNDRAWEHARGVLVQMDRDDMVDFLGQAFECCMCATQVVGLLLDWLSMRCRGNSLEEAGHRAWMDRLSALLQRHTTALEANLILTALNGRAAEALDVVPSLWLDLYRAFTHVLLHAQASVTGSPRSSRAVFSIPLHFLASNSREEGVFHAGALLLEGAGPTGDRLFCPCATYGAEGRGLILQSHVQSRTAASYYPRASDTMVFGCLSRMGGEGPYTLETCGMKGDKDGTDWITCRSDGLLSRWGQDPELCHDLQGVPSLVVCARIY